MIAAPAKRILRSSPRIQQAWWAKQSREFNFSVKDKLDTNQFNRILWEGLNGSKSPYPTIRNGASGGDADSDADDKPAGSR